MTAVWRLMRSSDQVTASGPTGRKPLLSLGGDTVSRSEVPPGARRPIKVNVHPQWQARSQGSPHCLPRWLAPKPGQARPKSMAKLGWGERRWTEGHSPQPSPSAQPRGTSELGASRPACSVYVLGASRPATAALAFQNMTLMSMLQSSSVTQQLSRCTRVNGLQGCRVATESHR